ncbi:DUF433 domain-containing protein [Candidatus Poriferisodalis sp.]|uniref:DUF433 domain-containing protein n=1 Tax=Candidatus Poriferisodalis sp. TaxID=3101277 RepID=UPI003B526736
MSAATTRERIAGEARYLGRGIYDVAEVARLIRCRRGRVESWTRPGAHLSPLLTAELHNLFSFWDLVSVRVIAELVSRRVSRQHIAEGARHLAEELGTDRPFAHEHLATVGSGFFAEIGGAWVDAGLGGQRAFTSMVEPLLRPIAFNEAHMAAIWRPATGVWINPAVQAGAPCVDGTRVPTGLLAWLVAAGGDDPSAEIEQACDDYQLSQMQVQQAVDFELELAA